VRNDKLQGIFFDRAGLLDLRPLPKTPSARVSRNVKKTATWLADHKPDIKLPRVAVGQNAKRTRQADIARSLRNVYQINDK